MLHSASFRKTIILITLSCSCSMLCSWGFFSHKHINKLAVFTLPPEMLAFYKKHINYITTAAVNADRRRFLVVDEAPRHYLDLDHFGDSALYKMPRYWREAVDTYSEDTLKAYGLLPWHINRIYYQLRDAFMIRDTHNILRLSADLGHYLADAHVPLHTTENYNGQLTAQEGIHAFWESRLPELFAAEYDLLTGKAEYISNPQLAAWKAIASAHLAVDSVLKQEKTLSQHFNDRKYSFETKGKQTMKVYAKEYSQQYHEALNGMVQRQMRASIKMVGSFWYSAWIDAGQPNLQSLLYNEPTKEELQENKEALKQWKQQHIPTRHHE